MIHSCLVCDRPATRRCHFEECHLIPFICGGKCKDDQNKAELIHTHNGKTYFSSYGDTINAAVSVKKIQNPLLEGLREKKQDAQTHYEKALKLLEAGNFEIAMTELMCAHSIYSHDEKYLDAVADLLGAAANQ